MDASRIENVSIPVNISRPLYDKWVLWAHLPHDTDWSLESYKKIMEITSVDQMIMLYRLLPEKMIKNCMLFLMRKGVIPMWEDKKNRLGGCFSYKISNKNVHKVWKYASYSLVGETLSVESKISPHINGITISPKKSFCIIKIWMDTCEFQNTREINSKNGLTPHGCIFKKHKPEY
tara:strand:- start:342 stop:869 length:528 start_codon:yes stop_codon:yes gene_type:complete